MTDQTYTAGEHIRLSATLDTRLAMRGNVPATAVLQDRRYHSRRYRWSANGGGALAEPLELGDTDPETADGGLAVGEHDTLTLSVPAGVLPPGRYAFQAAARHNGVRHEVPEPPLLVKIEDGGEP
jgi:hypothetical protein